MRLDSFVFAALLAAVPAVAAGQQLLIPPAVRAAADQISVDQIARDIEYLASDELRGRDTPSPGLDSAAAYIVRRLRRAGLRPMGDGGTYLQHYTVRELTLDTLSAYLELEGRRFGYGENFVVLGLADSLEAVARPVVYVGGGDAIDTLDLRGKFLLAHLPLASGLAAQLRNSGAAGVLAVPRDAWLPNWDFWRSADSRRDLDPWVPSAYASAPLTTVLLQQGVADALLEGEVLTRGAAAAPYDSVRKLAPFQLHRQLVVRAPLRSVAFHRAANVVAMIEGADAELKREYVTIASHLDGAVDSEPVNGDSIYNAADDNATGSAAALAVAEKLMLAPRPRRSIMFLWDSGEEVGLWGTRRFVSDPSLSLELIVAHFNVDMIGSTRAPGTADSASMDVTGPNEVYLIGPGVLSAGLDSLLQQVNREYLNLRYNRQYDSLGNEFFYPRTDAGPFLERGVMTVEYFTGIHDRYHMPGDEAKYLDPGKVTAVARTLLATVWVLANAPERPTADKGWPASLPSY